MNVKKLYSSLALFCCILFLTSYSSRLIAQIPTVQDCLGAIPVCQDIYVQPIVYGGQGAYPNEINGSQTCPRSCMDGETNSIWYVISVKTGGMLRFVISPVVVDDDYDWGVFNLNDYECSDIYNNAAFMQSSCNAAGGGGFHGATGVSTPNGGAGNCNGMGPTNKWNGDMPVQAGDTYVLCVSNWTPTSSAGYTLDFSASTADIFDDVPAVITAIDTVRGCSGSATVDFDFNENILCSSIQASDFTITGPDGLHYVDAVNGAGCLAGGTQEKFFSLSSFTPPITITGTYTINMVGDVEDLCLNPGMSPPVDFYAEMDPLPQVTDGPYDELVPIGASATFHVETIGTHTYRWQVRQDGGFWTNLNEGTPYTGTTTSTLTINPATINLGENQYRCIVSGDCTPPSQSQPATLFVGDALAASASANPEVICLGETTSLDVNAIGGNILQPYSYTWSSPDGWSSTLESPTVEPVETTTYTVIVDDGYNPVSVQVTVYVNPLPVAEAGDDASIFHGTFTTLQGSVPGGTPQFIYNWQPSDSLWDNTIQNPVTRKLRGATIFTLVVTDGNGCTGASDMVTINIIGGPLSASPSAQPNTICLGDTARLFALPSGGDTASYTYSWKVNGEEFSTLVSPIVVPDENTTYTLIVDDGSNSITRSVTVTVNPLPAINLYKPEYYIVDNVIQACVFDSLSLDPGFINGTYLWSNGSSSFSNTVATSGISFDYQKHYIKVTDNATGCVNNDSVSVAFTFTACSYGIQEMPLNDLVKIYPNPASNSVTLSIDGSEGNFSIEMTDLTGRSILKQDIKKTNTGIYNHLIDLSSISNTTCLIRISSKSGNIVRKLVISH